MDDFPDLCQAFRGHDVGFWEPLWRDSSTIARQVGRSGPEIREFTEKYRDQIANQLRVIPASRVAGDVLPTGDKNIDALLGGGVRTKCLTEICGQSSAGKTGLALQLCLSAQLTANTKTVYITTEDSLYIRRLPQLLSRFPNASLENVLTYKTSSHPMQLVRLVERQLPAFLTAQQVSLVVIDSISIFQDWLNTPECKLFIDTCRNLRRLAHQHNVAVVVTNQVRDRPAQRFTHDIEDYALFTENQERFINGWSTKPFTWDENAPNRLRPALGYIWTREIDQRLVIKREGESRKIQLVFSHYTKPGTVIVDLDANGFTARS